MDGRCPDTFHCSNGSRGFSAIRSSLLSLPIYSGLVSSSFSCLGAGLILLAYCTFRDLRKGTTQKIITLLSLADFSTAASYICTAIAFIIYSMKDHHTKDECDKFDISCQILGSLLLWSALCSFAWNAILAIHFLLATIFNCPAWINKLLPLYNIVGWGVPLAIVLPLLIVDKMGFEPDTRTCFTRWAVHAAQYVVVGLWYIPEILCTVIILVCYIAIIAFISYQQVCIMIILKFV